MTTITFHSDNTSRQRREAMMFGLLRVAAGINILALVGVCVFLLWNGSPAISWEFLTEPPRRMMTAGGVWPCIVGTFLLAFGAMLIAFPLGVASAVYLHEYGGKGRYTRYPVSYTHLDVYKRQVRERDLLGDDDGFISDAFQIQHHAHDAHEKAEIAGNGLRAGEDVCLLYTSRCV